MLVCTESSVYDRMRDLSYPFSTLASTIGRDFDLRVTEPLDPMSIALKGMSLKRAVVVHGAGGLDEASLAGSNQFRFLDKGSIKSEIIHKI